MKTLNMDNRLLLTLSSKTWTKSFCLLTFFSVWEFLIWKRCKYSNWFPGSIYKKEVGSFHTLAFDWWFWFEVNFHSQFSYLHYLKTLPNSHVFHHFQTEGIHWPDILSTACFFVCTFKIWRGLNVTVYCSFSVWMDWKAGIASNDVMIS